MALGFHTEGIAFKLKHPRITRKWLESAVKKERRLLVRLEYTFCADEFLLRLNKQFLNHNTLTDILTFSYSDNPSAIEGEIFISIPRVEENAVKFTTSFEHELHRIMIHGVLHLVGFGDKTVAERAEMRKKEDAYLSLYKVSRGT